jgi:tRNA A37 threonylcarbamoyladenosine dehydratase
VDAVKERILQINPMATVETVTDVIERVTKETFDVFANANGSIFCQILLQIFAILG